MLKYKGKIYVNNMPTYIKQNKRYVQEIPPDALAYAKTLAKINIKTFITALRNKIL